MPGMTPGPLTGDAVAQLIDLAESEHATWANVTGLPVPWVVDRNERIVYVDGRLRLRHYYEAVSEGLHELIGTRAPVIQLRPLGDGHRSTG